MGEKIKVGQFNGFKFGLSLSTFLMGAQRDKVLSPTGAERNGLYLCVPERGGVVQQK